MFASSLVNFVFNTRHGHNYFLPEVNAWTPWGCLIPTSFICPLSFPVLPMRSLTDLPQCFLYSKLRSFNFFFSCLRKLQLFTQNQTNNNKTVLFPTVFSVLKILTGRLGWWQQAWGISRDDFGAQGFTSTRSWNIRNKINLSHRSLKTGFHCFIQLMK